MGRSVLAVFVGIVVAVLAVFIVESVGHVVFPPPPGVDVSDPEALRELMERIPAGALAFVLLAWVLGSFLGGFTAAKIAVQHRLACALIVGVVMLGAGGMTMMMIPHPLWMMVLGVLLPVPAAWVGARLAGAR